MVTGGIVITVVVVVVIKVTVTTPPTVTVLVPPYSKDVVYGLGLMVDDEGRELVGNTSKHDELEQDTVGEGQICVPT